MDTNNGKEQKKTKSRPSESYIFNNSIFPIGDCLLVYLELQLDDLATRLINSSAGENYEEVCIKNVFK